MKRNPHETRSEVIFRYTDLMLRETRQTMESLSQRTAEHYVAQVPADARCVHFQMAGDVFHCAKINAQKLARYMKRDVNARFPVDLEEAWVAGLTEPYQADCKRELARRYGFLDVPAPDEASAQSDLKAFGAFIRESGAVMEKMAPLMADGQLHQADLPHVDATIEEIDRLVGKAETVKAHLLALKNPRVVAHSRLK